MLLNQQPITADTNKLIELISGYGLKIRLLNVRLVGDSTVDGDGDGDGDGDVDVDVDGIEGKNVIDSDGRDGGDESKSLASKTMEMNSGNKKKNMMMKMNTGTRMTKMITVKEPVLPSREGLDENYYYDIGTM